MPAINPNILEWARESAGLSIEEAVAGLGIKGARGFSPEDRLRRLESGEEEPSRAMLVKMSTRYHRPLLVFYLSDPPAKGERGSDFRTLGADSTDEHEARLDALLRDVKVRQSLIRSALEDEEEDDPLPFVGSARLNRSPDSTVASMVDVLGAKLDEFRSQRTAHDAFRYLRGKAEDAGIYVLLIGDLGSHHSKIGITTFRGYALADSVVPFVVINDDDSHGAWSFTLIHELAHIWLGETGISGYGATLEIERFCNQVAGEFLLPSHELSELHISLGTSLATATELVSEFARKRRISSTMVAYRLYLSERIGREMWEKLRTTYYELWQAGKNKAREEMKSKEGGPSYYVLRRHHLGQGFLSVVNRLLASGALTTSKAGRVLGVKSVNVQTLLDPTV